MIGQPGLPFLIMEDAEWTFEDVDFTLKARGRRRGFPGGSKSGQNRQNPSAEQEQ
jgi:hypothetical protein